MSSPLQGTLDYLTSAICAKADEKLAEKRRGCKPH
jgi:hypothetical protein